MENILEPRAIGKLLHKENHVTNYNFFIPSYQRGYRWDTEQVEDLLNDLFEFIQNSKSNDETYCLQPIVVKEIEDGRYEVLDGQQRLTTIYLLLKALQKDLPFIQLFDLEYETRPNSAIFLKNIEEIINDENPDYHYMSNAFIVINNWLKNAKNKKANISTRLFDVIVESIEFIWYEIKNEVDAIDVFTRINIGKIPLTNSELVKAVFLSKNNLSLGYASEDISDKDFAKILSLKQNVIALQWDQMEKTLHDPKIWGFIYSGSIEYETRIDYLLDLISKKTASEKNEYFSFKYFFERVKEAKSDKLLHKQFTESNYSVIENEWDKIKEIFNILLEWYSQKKYNHFIGFLINQTENTEKIQELILDFQSNNREIFIRNVKDKIRNMVNCKDLSKLRYRINNKQLERILLLQNVINSLKLLDDNNKFPFEKFKEKKWTLEHIFAQNSDDLREEDYEEWLKDHLMFFKSKYNDRIAEKICAKIEKILASENKKIDKEDFQDCFKEITNYIQKEIQIIDQQQYIDNPPDETELNDSNTTEESKWINDDHSIANLALLDGSVNSAIKNSIFSRKRNIILEKDKGGNFIPNETKKVFLKYYTPTPNHLGYWTYNDRKAYVENIVSTLNELN